MDVVHLPKHEQNMQLNADAAVPYLYCMSTPGHTRAEGHTMVVFHVRLQMALLVFGQQLCLILQVKQTASNE